MFYLKINAATQNHNLYYKYILHFSIPLKMLKRTQRKVILDFGILQGKEK